MMENRSAPPGPVVPCLTYEDVSQAIGWLCGAFGFTERLRTPPEPDGTIHHAQLAVGLGSIILTSQKPGEYGSVRSLVVRVEDIDAHCERARKFGARILMEPGTKEFGERQYAAEDLAGHRWAFTQSVADVNPGDWGAQVKEIKSPLALLPRPRLCYMEVPALDVHQSASFYESVFGWTIRHRESDRPSFDAPHHVSGAWVTGRPPSRTPGLLPYIWVDDIHATLAQAAAHGGEVVEPPYPDHPGSPCLIATFRDPAGNLIGLYQEPL